MCTSVSLYETTFYRQIFFILQTHSDDKSKSEKGRKTAKPMKIIEEDDEDPFKGGLSDKVGRKSFTFKPHC